MPQKSLVIVVSAPSGGGKTTIVSKLLEKLTGAKRSVSYTTRKPRDIEENGKDYIFISEDEFRRKIKNNEFLEWENNFGWYYGTLKEQIINARNEGVDIVMSIDVRGARNVRKEFPDAVSIFIKPPSFETLKERLENRNTDSEEMIKVRLNEAEREMDGADEFDYLVVNDDLEEAVDELTKIIEAEKANRKNKKEENHGTDRKG